MKEPFLKRLFDITFSLILFLITLPLFFCILIAIVLEHLLCGDFFASLFYTEPRISQGKLFHLVKFNIFRPKFLKKVKREGVTVHSKELERRSGSMAFVGKIIKKIYLDELPQLYSIIKGDLSVVGPRPVHVSVYKKRLEKGDFTKSIIKAGLTGNFQSQKGLTNKTDQELDQEYIDFCKMNPGWKIVLYDIKIILRTIKVLIRAQGI